MINFEVVDGGQFMAFISRNILEQIVDIGGFSAWCLENRSSITGLESIPLSWYVAYYDERSKVLAKRESNPLSKEITNAAQEKSKRLSNDVEYRQQQAQKWAKFD